MNSANKKIHIPFWNPWGAKGCLIRSLVFLFGIIVIAFVLSSILNFDFMKTSHTPFWQPWGAGGCLWRSLLFLLGLLLIIFFAAVLFRSCGQGSQDPPLDKFNDSTDYYKNLPPELLDSSIVADWNDTIPNVPELPEPDRNFIPPVDSTEIIKNPEDSITHIVGDQLIVFFNSKDVKNDMASFAKQFKQNYPGNNYQIIYYNPSAGTMLIGVPQAELVVIADALPNKIKGIDFLVTFNEIINGDAKPSDPGFKETKYDEYYKLIQAYDAWNITKGSKDVKVAIVDSYFDLSNPEIGERYSDRINISTKRVNVLPPNTAPTKDQLATYCHGSHVAGLAIGSQDNKLGCSGIAPKCSWIPIALGCSPWSVLHIYEGVLYAIYHNADVVNLSIGCVSEDVSKLPIGDQIRIAASTSKRAEAIWEYIVKTANDHNCIICKAAGNETALMGLDFMSRSKNVVNVEAVDNKGQQADFSNFGIIKEAGVHYSTVAAPGVGMWSVTDKRCVPIWQAMGEKASADGFQEMQGTSMATPIVAGAVALLKSKKKDITADEVIKILVMTGKQTDKRNLIGPTIQIKDALDATGGALANFDDLMKDHNKIIGKWRSTYELIIENPTTHKKLDDMWTYFIFTSATSGRLEDHAINNKRIYTAPLSVKWEKDRILITQHGDAVAADGNKLNKDDFICVPDSKRLLKTDCMRNGKKRYDFQLEKVN